MSFFASIVNRLFAPPFDDLSRKKNTLQWISRGFFLAILLVAVITFSYYDSNHPITSITTQNEPFSTSHLLIQAPQLTGDCWVRTVLGPPFNFVALASSTYKGNYIIVSLVDPDTKLPMTDLSRYTIYFQVSARGCDPSIQGIPVYFVDGDLDQYMNGLNEMAGREFVSQNNVTWFGSGLNSIVDLTRQRRVFSNGTQITTVKQTTRFVSMITNPAVYGSYSTYIIDDSVQITLEETRFGLAKRILVDIGSTLSLACFASTILVFVVIRCMYKDPHTWVPHASREDILITVANK